MLLAKLSRPWVIGAIVMLAFIAVFFVFASTPTRPTLEFVGTEWRVESVGVRIPPEGDDLSVAFFANNAVRVRTGCQDLDGRYVRDTDGYALSFGDLVAEPNSCGNQDAAELQGALLAALLDVEEWTYASGGENRIQLLGGQEIVLAQR